MVANFAVVFVVLVGCLLILWSVELVLMVVGGAVAVVAAVPAAAVGSSQR